MTNPAYNYTDGVPVAQSRGASSPIRNEYSLIGSGFDIMQNYAVDTGTANAMVIAPPANLVTLSDGLRFWIKAASSITGATTVNMGTLGIKDLRQQDGTALTNQIISGQIFLAIYDGTAGYLKLATSGQTLAANGLPITGGTMTGAINEAHGADIASASTVNLQTATGNLVDITGSVTITTITLADGAERTVRFTGTPILTNGASLVLLGGANITAAASSFAIFRGYPAGVVRMVYYSGVSLSGGGSQISSSINIALTSASNRVQSITLTTTGLAVSMPDATTLTTGGPTFILSGAAASNAGVFRDNAGNALTTLVAGTGYIFNLVDNSTAAGVWLVKTFSSITQLIAGIATVGNAAASTDISVCQLSSTTAIVACDNGTTLATYVLTITGNSVSFGAVSNPTSGGVLYVSVARLSATKAICTYRKGSDTFLKAVILDVSGTTITPGAILAVNAANSSYANVATLSSTLAICTYAAGSVFVSVCLSISGSTITAGAINTSAITCNGYNSIAMLTATKAIAVWRGTSNFFNTVILDVSGTTITLGSSVVVNAAASLYFSIAALSATKAICTYSGTSTYLESVILDVAISTITPATVFTVNGAASTYTSVSILNSTTALCTYFETTLKAVLLSVSTSAITAGSPSTISSNAVASNYNSLALLGGSKFIDAYAGTSNYLQAQTVEYTVSI